MIASLTASGCSSVTDSMLPLFFSHPNRLVFWGTLCPLDEPSDRPPSGARGHKVILTRRAAEEALPSLMGMAVDYAPGWDGHDSRRKCGIITMATIKKRRLLVGGYLFVKDFPEVETAIRGKVMGMSYECAGAHVDNMGSDTWEITKIEAFTGAAVLLQGKAAYRKTRFELA